VRRTANRLPSSVLSVRDAQWKPGDVWAPAYRCGASGHVPAPACRPPTRYKSLASVLRRSVCSRPLHAVSSPLGRFCFRVNWKASSLYHVWPVSVSYISPHGLIPTLPVFHTMATSRAIVRLYSFIQFMALLPLL